MRILLLTQVVVYPADAGPKVKTLQVLRYLAARHTVMYCTFARNAGEIQAANSLRSLCSRIATVLIRRSWMNNVRFLIESLLTGDAFLLRRDECSSMHTVVHQLLCEERIEVLHVDQLNMMRFVPEDWSGIVVLDEHNALWQVVERWRKGTHNPFKRWFLTREARLIREIEAQACQRAQVVLAVSEQDKRVLREIAGDAVPIEVVPITVDVESLDAIRARRNPGPHRLLSIGTMFWPSNSEGIIWWLSEGYARLHELCPEAIYDIVGARPPSSLQRLAAHYTGVRLHGYVADVSPFWISATALAVPLLSGGGVRVKIMEAMALGVPVISTTIGCEGLDVEDNVHLLIADTPETFATACAAVLQDEMLARRLAENARQLIVKQYDAKYALQILETVYNGFRDKLI
ncbi:MAG: glycosyltransferase [Chloroflexi bacterium]|nr:glycosyltransferase [Chloroflexota bacterium]